MRYDAYENKVKKVAAVLKVLVRHSTKILIGLAVFTVLLSALLVAKGTVMSADCPKEIVYGDSVSCNANAFLSKVSFEFCSGGEWTATAPTMPGEYKVRAVGKTTFGGTRYGKEMSLTIKNKGITVDFASDSVIYGSMPVLKASLVNGDKISCEGFDFGEYVLNSETGKITSTVTPIKEKLKITNKDGSDVTSAYDITVEPKTIDVLPKALGVTVSDKSAEYNGMKLAYDGYEISNGALFGEDMLQAVFSDYIIDVGSVTNTPDLRVVDKNGKDITYCYDISTTSGKLTVEPRPLIITTPSDSFVYDGKDHSNYPLYESPETPLVSGHGLYVVGCATVNDVGTYDNTVNIKIFENLTGEEKTDNYSVFVNMGTITVTPRPITVYTESDDFIYDGNDHQYGVEAVDGLAEGHSFSGGAVGMRAASVYPIEVEVHIYNENGKPVTQNYDIKYEYGTVTIRKRPVTIIPNGNTWTYDGYFHSETGYTLGSGSMDFAPSDTLLVTRSVQITDAGSVQNEFFEYKILSINISADVDISSNYDISFGEGGMLTVLPRHITIAPVYVEKIYDDEPLYAKDVEIISGNLAGVNHFVSAEVTGWRTYPGTTESKILSAKVQVPREGMSDKVIYDDVSHNYDITYAPGHVVVLERPITVIPNDAEKVYDGTPLVATSAYVSDKPYKLVNGHYLAGVSFGGWQTTVGVGDSYAYDAVIRDINGEDVTDYYDISYGIGKLTVTPRIIYIEPVYAEREYDGTPLMATAWQYCSDTPYELVASHAITDIIYTGSITDVGEETSGIDIYSVIILDRYLDDNTPNYEIVAREGKLKVTRRVITVKFTDTTKVYDGLKTVQGKLAAVSGSFADGHYGTVTVTTFSANVGTYIPTISKESTVIYNENGQNVIDNYSVSYVSSGYSYVTIEKRAVTLKPVNEKKVYDGTPLYPEKIEVSKSSPNELVKGHFAVGSFMGEQTEVGKSDSSILTGSVFIYDQAQVDGLVPLNDNYDITLENGTLTVLEKEPSGGGGGGGSDDGGGGSGSGQLDLSGNISGGEPSEDDEKVVHYKVKSEISGPVYIKLKSFGAYSGRSWSEATAYDKLIRSTYGADYLTSSAFGALAPSYRIEIESLTGQYALPYYLMAEADRNFEYDVQKSDVFYEGNADVIYSAYYSEFDWNADYTQSSAVIKKYESEYRSFVYNQYLAIDDETYEYMLSVVESNGLNESNTRDTVLMIAEYMRTKAAVYDLKYDRALDNEENIAIAFLETYKTGICQHYATAATLMYRAVGIPARYTVGYVGNTEAGEWCEITANTAHAWVEVYLDGIGWVQVEVTGSSEMGAPDDDEERIEINPTYQYKKYDGDWLYPKNELDGNVYFSELLEQGYTYKVEVSGAQLEVGYSESVIENFILYDPNGNDVTAEFDIIFYNGMLEVIAAEITTVEVQLYELQQYYNGKPLEYVDGDYRILTKLEGVTVKLKLNIRLVEVGKISFSKLNANSDMYAEFVVLNSAGQDITRNYKLVFVPLGDCDNPIKVDAREIEITTGSAEKQYDGKPLTNGNHYITRGSLVDGHTITLYTMGEITEVGSVDNAVDIIEIYDSEGRDVTKNYKITVVEGILTVLPEAE